MVSVIHGKIKGRQKIQQISQMFNVNYKNKLWQHFFFFKYQEYEQYIQTITVRNSQNGRSKNSKVVYRLRLKSNIERPVL